MTGILILIALLAVPYLAFNLRRLYLGRRWAFTFCQAAKDWEERERARLLAVRAARPAGSGGQSRLAAERAGTSSAVRSSAAEVAAVRRGSTRQRFP